MQCYLFLEASIALNETNKKVAQKEEEYSLVEAECKNLMSELAQHVQNKVRIRLLINSKSNQNKHIFKIEYFI